MKEAVSALSFLKSNNALRLVLASLLLLMLLLPCLVASQATGDVTLALYTKRTAADATPTTPTAVFNSSLGLLRSTVDDLKAANVLCWKNRGDCTSYFIIHGFKSKGDDKPFQDIKNELFKRHKQKGLINVFICTWKKASLQQNWGDYVRTVNEFVPNTVSELMQITQGLLNNEYLLKNDTTLMLHCIGHSLGAQTCGLLGKQVDSINKIKMKRITGLDPAGPCYNIWGPERKLNRNDAAFVDVIHTSSILGHNKPLGHVDFYPNGGQNQYFYTKEEILSNNLAVLGFLVQPDLISFIEALGGLHLSCVVNTKYLEIGLKEKDCMYPQPIPPSLAFAGNSLNLYGDTCHHNAALQYFVRSINPDDCIYEAYKCATYTSYKDKKCFAKESTTMGLLAKPLTNGNYYLELLNNRTDSLNPHCFSNCVLDKKPAKCFHQGKYAKDMMTKCQKKAGLGSEKLCKEANNLICCRLRTDPAAAPKAAFDVLFVIDTEIRERATFSRAAHFEKSIDFARRLIEDTFKNMDGAQVALIAYSSSKVEVLARLGTTNDLDDTLSVLSSLEMHHVESSSKPSQTANALLQGQKVFSLVNDTRGPKEAVSKQVFLLTDGAMENSQDAVKAAEQLEADGAQLFSIGVGSDPHYENLQALSSSDSNTYLLKDYDDDDFERLVEFIERRSVTEPAVIPEATSKLLVDENESRYLSYKLQADKVGDNNQVVVMLKNWQGSSKLYASFEDRNPLGYSGTSEDDEEETSVVEQRETFDIIPTNASSLYINVFGVGSDVNEFTIQISFRKSSLTSTSTRTTSAYEGSNSAPSTRGHYTSIIFFLPVFSYML